MTTDDGSNRPRVLEIGDDPPLREQLAETFRGIKLWYWMLLFRNQLARHTHD